MELMIQDFYPGLSSLKWSLRLNRIEKGTKYNLEEEQDQILQPSTMALMDGTVMHVPHSHRLLQHDYLSYLD